MAKGQARRSVHGYGIPKGEFISEDSLSCGVEHSDEKYNPFDVYVTSDKQSPVDITLLCCNRWRHLLIEVQLSVQNGNIVKHLRNIPKKPEVAEHEFQIVDPDDEDGEINTSDHHRLPTPIGSASQIMVNIRDLSHAKIARTNPPPIAQRTATAPPNSL